MKTRLFVLAIMLLSSASSALADTRKVDEKHLQQHRVFEKKNLEQQRFKLELELDKLPQKNPPFDFQRIHGIDYFGQYHLNQSGMPLAPSNYSTIKCEPSFSKTWDGYGDPPLFSEPLLRRGGLIQNPQPTKNASVMPSEWTEKEDKTTSPNNTNDAVKFQKEESPGDSKWD